MKVRNCGMSLIKYILFAFNIVLALSGLAILIVGVGAHVLLEGRITGQPIVIIITGTIIFLIASLGCFGAITESRILLITYSVLLAVSLAAVFIIVGMSAIVFRNNLEMGLKDSLLESIKRSNDVDLNTWDKIQKNFMCCGLYDTSDWKYLSRNKILRPSCCRAEYVDSNTGDCEHVNLYARDKYYQEGCVGKLREYIKNNAVIVIGVGIGISFIQLLGIFLACSLASAIRRERGATQ